MIHLLIGLIARLHRSRGNEKMKSCSSIVRHTLRKIPNGKYLALIPAFVPPFPTRMQSPEPLVAAL